jgi:hypothetical protein
VAGLVHSAGRSDTSGRQRCRVRLPAKRNQLPCPRSSAVAARAASTALTWRQLQTQVPPGACYEFAL